MSLEKTQHELGRAVSTHEEFGGEGVPLKAVKTPIFKHYVLCTQSFTEQQVPHPWLLLAPRSSTLNFPDELRPHEHTESQTYRYRERGAQQLPCYVSTTTMWYSPKLYMSQTKTKKHCSGVSVRSGDLHKSPPMFVT